MSHASPIGTVRTDRSGSVAILTIDFPPLNLGSEPMRKVLLDALLALDGMELSGVVLTGVGSAFVAGSDFREFDAPPREPHLPDIIAAIENLPVPVVAAINGAALGGGCELALGCDWRVATGDAVLGLPEATLGLIPGAGGTVRLPRLVGVEAGIDMVASGKRIGAEEALALGLIDAVADGDLLSAALAWLQTHPGKRRATDLPVPSISPDSVEAQISAIERRARGAIAPVAAARAVSEGIGLPAAEALQRERAESLRLRVGPQSKALRYLFQAERRAGRGAGRADTRVVKTVGVVGAGRMGTDIALVFAAAGFPVRLVETQDAVIARAKERIAEEAQRFAKRGNPQVAEALQQRIVFNDIDMLSDCELVVEVVPEDMALKRGLLAQLEAIVPPETILATNTSYLDIDVMGQDLLHPERLVGLHFFNPATILKLVEVVRPARADEAVVATVLQLARQAGKLPIVTAVGEGFVGNRIFAAYRRHCEYLLEDGCLPQEIDAAMRRFGMAMGPFEVFDLAGLDVAWAMRKRLAPQRDPAERYVDIPDLLCEAGRLGRRAGHGWYDYVDGKPKPSAMVEQVIVSASAQKGIARSAFAADAIVERLLAAMANEALLLVEDGIASQPADVDVALCNGFGFPRHAGGVLYWASTLEAEELDARLDAIARISGRPRAGLGIDVSATLAKIAKSD